MIRLCRRRHRRRRVDQRPLRLRRWGNSAGSMPSARNMTFLRRTAGFPFFRMFALL
jgi:hypothetical protein